MSIQDYLYSEKFIPDVIERYAEELSSSNNLPDIMHANKLRVYRRMIFDADYLEETRKFFDKCFKLVKEKYSVIREDKQTIGCSIAGRRKGLIQSEEKCRLYMKQGLSLNLVRDFFAFRFVLYGNVENLQEYCYKVAEDVIELAIRNGFTICEALPLLDSATEKKLAHSTFRYSGYVKDYIQFPKKNGYQSLHFVLVDLQGRHLEIQVRTDSMHLLAEKAANQNHVDYKESKYNQRLIDSINRERISIVGYKCLSKRTQIIEYLADKVTSAQLEQINNMLSDNLVTKDTLYTIRGFLSESENIDDDMNYIRQIQDKIIDLAGVETGVSIFHRQTF